MTSESFDDFDAFGNRCAEVLKSHRKIALINVVRADSDFDELAYQVFHYVCAVVDASEQYRLVAERYACIGKTFTRS